MAGRRDVYDRALNEGISFAWDQQWEKAIAAYRIALTEFPEDATVLSNVGQALLALNRPKDALLIYQRAAQVSQGDPLPLEKCAELLESFGQIPQAAQAYFLVGELYVGRRDIDKALESWLHAALLMPGNFQVYSRLAVAYERTGKTPEAISAYIEMARLLQAQGDIPKAIQAAQHAMQLDPQHPEASKAFSMIQRGEILPEIRRTPKGVTGMLRRLDAFAPPAPAEIDKKPNFKEGSDVERKFNPFEKGRQLALTLLAESLFESDETSTLDLEPPKLSGTGFLRLGGKKEPPKTVNRAQILSNLSQAIEAQTQGDVDTALAFYEKTAKAGMDQASLYYIMGANWLEKEQYETAIKNFTVAAKNPQFAAGAHYGLGICYGRSDRMNEAITHLLTTLRYVDLATVPSSQTLILNTLYESFVEGMKQASPTEEDLVRVGENMISFMSGRDWEDRIRLSRLQMNKQSDGTLAPLAELLLIPRADRIVESMSMVGQYMAHGWWQSAMDEAQRAIESSPLYLPAHIKIAEILVKENRLEAAVAKYTVIADLYNVRGETHRTAEIYEQIAILAPMDINARAKLIEMLTMQGKTAEAIEQYLEMGLTYYDLADLDNARKTYANALTLAQRPHVTDKSLALKVLLRMGEIDMQRLDWRQAMVTYAQVKTLDPYNDQGRAVLVSLYLRTGQSRPAMAEADEFLKVTLGRGEVSKAITFLEMIVRDHSEEIGLRSRLARIYQETGRKADAISQLDAIADAQLQAGNRAEAIKVVQAIISMAPTNLAEYQQILAELQAG